MSLPKPTTPQLDQPPKRPSVVSRHSSGSREQLSSSHQKPKVAHHVGGKRNKSSSHLVKLNKSHSAKNLVGKNLKPLAGTRVKRSSSHIKFKVSQDEGEHEEPTWDGPEMTKGRDHTGKGKGRARAASEADSGDEASSEGETESSREPSSSRGPPVKRHSILKNSPLVKAANNEPVIQDDMTLPEPAQEDTSTRVRAHRMVSFAAEPQISQISNITSHDSTSTAAEEQSEQSGSVEDAYVVDARSQGSRVADVPAGQQTDSQSVENETSFHHQPHTQKSDLAASPGSDQEESAEEPSSMTDTHDMEPIRQQPRQTTFHLGQRQQPEQGSQEAQDAQSQPSVQHAEEAPSEQSVQQAQEEPAPATQPQQIEAPRHQPRQTTFQLGQKRQPERRSQEAQDTPSEQSVQHTQEQSQPSQTQQVEVPRHQPRQTTFQLGQRKQTHQTEQRSQNLQDAPSQHKAQEAQEAQPQQSSQRPQEAQPHPKSQHVQQPPQMPRATHQQSTNTTRSNSNTHTPSRNPTPDHEHNDHPALPLPLHNLDSSTPLTRPSTPISPQPDSTSSTTSTNPTHAKSMSRTQYKLAMERQHVLNFRPPRQRPTNAPLPSNLTGQTDPRIDPTTGRVMTKHVCGEAKKDLAALRMITRRDPVCEAVDGLRLWGEWEDREGAWTADHGVGSAGAGPSVRGAMRLFGGRRAGHSAHPAERLSVEEVARKKRFVAFLAEGGLQRKLREMWEAPVE